MEQKIQQLNELGLQTGSGLAYTGSEENYMETLVNYVNFCEGNIADIENHFKSGRLQRYMVAVHAVKSNSKMIGHTALFEAFRGLEFAARDGDTDYIAANNDNTLRLYREFVEKLSSIVTDGEKQAAPELSAAEAKETAAKLLEALDDFDDELSAKLVHALSGYPFAISDKEKLDKAAKLITDFIYDDAAELIKDLSRHIY
ncbi:MAG: hypothetical protein II820_07275 [Ruminiclostridium sp.]|nr:hypothetical protein [Ruminiclostridium sp.]